MTARQTTSKKPEPKQPTYHAYSVTEGKSDGDKGRWIKLGVAFAHDDGEGLSLILDALPIHFDGRIVIRAPKAE